MTQKSVSSLFRVVRAGSGRAGIFCLLFLVLQCDLLFGAVCRDATYDYSPGMETSGKTMAVKISTVDRGIYRVTGLDLLRLGVDLTIVETDKMALVHYDTAMPIYTEGLADRRFDAEDAIYFFSEGGQENTIPYINTEHEFYPNNQTFMLYLVGSRFQPLRYKEIPMQTPSWPDPRNYWPVTATGHYHFEKDVIWQFFESANQRATGKTDFIFWDRMTYPSSDRSESGKSFIINLPHAETDKDAELKVCLFAASDIQGGLVVHRTLVLVNGHEIGKLVWRGTNQIIRSLKVPPGVFRSGNNEVSFKVLAPGVSKDVEEDVFSPEQEVEQQAGEGLSVDLIMLDWFDVNFKQSTQVYYNYNEFRLDPEKGAAGPLRLRISGFSHPNLLTFDLAARECLKPLPFQEEVGAALCQQPGSLLEAALWGTKPSPTKNAFYLDGGAWFNFVPKAAVGRPRQTVGPYIKPAGESYYAINLDRPQTSTTLISMTREMALRPKNMKRVSIKNLFQTPNDCDLLILSNPLFMTALEPLVEWKTQRGLRVKLVDISDIFNEITGGYVTPEALRQYIKYLYESQPTPALRYVLLVGDSTTISKYQTFCPAYAYLQSGTHANDNYFACFDRPSGMPQLAVGRFSVQTVEQAENVVRKTINYEREKAPGLWQDRFLMISAAFDWAREDVEKIVASNIRPNYLTSIIQTDVKTTDMEQHLKINRMMTEGLNAGSAITVFFGHGGGTVWEVGPAMLTGQFRAHLFDQSHVAKLTNYDRPTLIFAMTCYTNDFDNPYVGQTLGETFVNSRGGAIAVFGSSSRSSTASNYQFSNKMIHLIQERSGSRLGDYFLATKKLLNTDYVNSSYILLGDPSLEFRLPFNDIQVFNPRMSVPASNLEFAYQIGDGDPMQARLECPLPSKAARGKGGITPATEVVAAAAPKSDRLRGGSTPLSAKIQAASDDDEDFSWRHEVRNGKGEDDLLATSMVTLFYANGAGSVWELDPAPTRNAPAPRVGREPLMSKLGAPAGSLGDYDYPYAPAMPDQAVTTTPNWTIASDGEQNRVTMGNSHTVSKILDLLVRRGATRVGDFRLKAKNQFLTSYVNSHYEVLSDPFLVERMNRLDLRVARARWSNPASIFTFDYRLPEDVKIPATLDCYLIGRTNATLDQWRETVKNRRGTIYYPVRTGLIEDGTRLVVRIGDFYSGEHITGLELPRDVLVNGAGKK